MLWGSPGILIYGAGDLGRRAMAQIGNANVLAFVDSDQKKVGSLFWGKPVIDLKQYQKNYPGRFLLICAESEDEIAKQLDVQDICSYFRLSDCPAEFSAVEPHDTLKKYVLSHFQRKSATLYGGSFYTLLLADWFSKDGSEELKVVFPSSQGKKFFVRLQDEFPALSIFSELVLETEWAEELLVTDEWELPHLRETYPSIHVQNVFDIMRDEPSYFSKRMADLRESHVGETCFFIGTGPSLTMSDLETLHRHHVKCFSANHIFNAFLQTEWRPDYYVVSDASVVRELAGLGECAGTEYQFIADVSQDFFQKHKETNVIKYHFAHGMPRREPCRFSRNVAQGVYYGATVCYVALQIAAYMGFKTIYLLGVDGFAPKGGSKKHGHFYDGGALLEPHHTNMTERAYHSARQYADAHGIKIYNATRGGYVETFERVEFDAMF